MLLFLNLMHISSVKSDVTYFHLLLCISCNYDYNSLAMEDIQASSKQTFPHLAPGNGYLIVKHSNKPYDCTCLLGVSRDVYFEQYYTPSDTATSCEHLSWLSQNMEACSLDLVCHMSLISKYHPYCRQNIVALLRYSHKVAKEEKV